MCKLICERSQYFTRTLFLFSSIIILMVSCTNAGHNREDNSKNIVFLISKDPNNYEADRTIPLFAKQLETNFNFETHVLLGGGDRTAYKFPDLSLLEEADLLVVFCRRLALSDSQMNQIKQFIEQGKSVLGIRTANHAFTLQNENPAEGFTDWPKFVAEVLGCENRGYGPVDPGTNISVESSQASHPILQGIDETYWHTIGNVYKVAPLLDGNATILLRGNVEEEGLDEPVAWIRKNRYGGKVFYSSLGHPADFENADNIKILNQAVAWLTHEFN